MDALAGQLRQQLARVPVRVDGDPSGGLAAAMEPCRVGHADLDPAGDPAGEVAHEKSRFVSRRHTLGQRDAFLILETIGQDADEHVLGSFRRMPCDAQLERFVDAAVHVGEIDRQNVNRCSLGHDWATALRVVEAEALRA
jgi:hypothetical protein